MSGVEGTGNRVGWGSMWEHTTASACGVKGKPGHVPYRQMLISGTRDGQLYDEKRISDKSGGPSMDPLKFLVTLIKTDTLAS